MNEHRHPRFAELDRQIAEEDRIEERQLRPRLAPVRVGKFIQDAPARRIIAEVAREYSVTRAEITGPCQEAQFVAPRHEAMRRVWELRDQNGTQCYSAREIGKLFGGRHYTTVLHAVAKASRLRRVVQREPQWSAVAGWWV